MRIAWPELIVLIVAATLFVLGAEFAVLAAVEAYRVTGWIVGPAILVMLFGDLWGLLRLIDWAFAGPARRKGQRVL